MSSTLNWIAASSGGDMQFIALTLVRVSLVLTLAWFCHFMWRRSNPQLKVLIWRSTALGLFSMLVFNFSAFGWPIPSIPAFGLRPQASSSGEIRVARAGNLLANRGAPVPQSSDSGTLNTIKPPLQDVNVHEDRSATHATSETPKAAQTVAGEHGDESSTLALAYRTIVIFWLVGVAGSSAVWLWGAIGLASLIRKSDLVAAKINQEAGEIAAKIGVMGKIDIRHSNDFQSPCTVGVWRSTVIIPSRQCNPSERQELRASLAHEFAHCLGSDLRWNHLLILLQTLLWFHPLAWSIRLAHADACDEVCDARAARFLGDRALYVRLLARLALRVSNQHPASAICMARRSQVRLRLETVGRNMMRHDLSHWAINTLVCCGVMVVVLIGTATPSYSEAPAVTSGGELSRQQTADVLRSVRDVFAENIAGIRTWSGTRTVKIRERRDLDTKSEEPAYRNAIASIDFQCNVAKNQLRVDYSLSSDRRGRPDNDTKIDFSKPMVRFESVVTPTQYLKFEPMVDFGEPYGFRLPAIVKNGRSIERLPTTRAAGGGLSNAYDPRNEFLVSSKRTLIEYFDARIRAAEDTNGPFSVIAKFEGPVGERKLELATPYIGASDIVVTEVFDERFAFCRTSMSVFNMNEQLVVEEVRVDYQQLENSYIPKLITTIRRDNEGDTLVHVAISSDDKINITIEEEQFGIKGLSFKEGDRYVDRVENEVSILDSEGNLVPPKEFSFTGTPISSRPSSSR